MEWKELFPSDRQPAMEQIEDYIGGEGKKLWQSLIDYMDKSYKIKPKLTYSVCAEKPGWNMKFQKNGQSLGTYYPEEKFFSVFLVIGYKFVPQVEEILPDLSENYKTLYNQARDYMKIGKWMMLQIKDQTNLDDMKRLISVKFMPLK